MTTATINLKRFSAKSNSSAYPLQNEPHQVVHNGRNWTVATNGFLAVMVAGESDALVARGQDWAKMAGVIFPQGEKYLVDYQVLCDWSGKIAPDVECKTCEGTGEVDCKECEGNGYTTEVCRKCEHQHDCNCDCDNGTVDCGSCQDGEQEPEPIRGRILDRLFNKQTLARLLTALPAVTGPVEVRLVDKIISFSAVDWHIALAALSDVHLSGKRLEASGEPLELTAA